MVWFEKPTGFRELDYDSTRANSKSMARDCNRWSSERPMASASSRFCRSRICAIEQERCAIDRTAQGPCVVGDVRAMHQMPENAGAVFQVASQFNFLEMIGPNLTPEHGVTRYQYDRTQGPACAIAAGAATIYRNYCAPVAAAYGQTANRESPG